MDVPYGSDITVNSVETVLKHLSSKVGAGQQTSPIPYEQTLSLTVKINFSPLRVESHTPSPNAVAGRHNISNDTIDYQYVR